MSTLKKAGQPNLKQIVIFRALQLGDMLNAVPAFRALRKAYPDARITLVGLPWSTEFVERFHHYLDDFIIFPGFPGLPEQAPNVTQLPSFLRWMQAMEIDLAIQMQGSGKITNSVVSLWGAKQLAGFYLPGNYCPDPGSFLEYPENETEIWRHLRLMEFLGIPLQGDELEFPSSKKTGRNSTGSRTVTGCSGTTSAFIRVRAKPSAAGRPSILRKWQTDWLPGAFK